MNFTSVNPFTETHINEYTPITHNECESLLVESKQAFLDWSTQSIYQRIVPIYAITTILDQRINEIAHLISLEMGKPISEAKAEVEKCILLSN